jgi:predicted DNA-binding protein (MmcQ/YjbR family)
MSGDVRITVPMSRADLAALRTRLLNTALELPEAYVDHPWGEDVAKVNKKVFVFLSNGDPAHGYLMTVKLPLSGGAAAMVECAEPAGYGLGRSGWISLRHDRPGLPPVEVLEDWIEESYRAVAPKRLVNVLDATRE